MAIVLDERYERILYFLQKHDHIYDTNTVCQNTSTEIADVLYLRDKLHFLKWYDYGIPALDSEGLNYLA